MGFFPEELRTVSEGLLARKIIDAFHEKISRITSVDVVIVGAGPAGLSASLFLAKNGFQVVVLERGIGVGGGMRGGSILLPVGLVEEGEAASIVRELGVRLKPAGDHLYVVDPTELAVKLAAKAIDAGATIWPGVIVEDLITRGRGASLEVRGVLVNWTTIYESGWHVDPFYIESRAVVDATGHEASIIRILAKRHPELELRIPGMSTQNTWVGEEEVVEKTGRVVNGLYVAGMSVAELYNTHRMGPVFGGMLVSGKRVAEIISLDLGKPIK
jgi:thiazole biosynthesis enzyme